MPREYRRIKQYEKEIFKLREEGYTYRQIGEQFGFEQIKIKRFFERHRINQKKLEAGIPVKPRTQGDGPFLPSFLLHKTV